MRRVLLIAGGLLSLGYSVQTSAAVVAAATSSVEAPESSGLLVMSCAATAWLGVVLLREGLRARSTSPVRLLILRGLGHGWLIGAAAAAILAAGFYFSRGGFSTPGLIVDALGLSIALLIVAIPGLLALSLAARNEASNHSRRQHPQAVDSAPQRARPREMTAVLSQSLAHEVLGLLLNGASHVASLYASVSRKENGRVDVNAFLSTLDLLVREGLISPEADTGFGLVPVDPSTNASRLSAHRDVLPKLANPMWDDIGLWYRVTPRGEARWQLVAGEEVLPLVDVKLDIGRRIVTGVAATEAEAERAVADAIGAIPGGQLLKGTRVIERGISVTLPDGRALKEGIRVTYQVRGPFRSPPARD